MDAETAKILAGVGAILAAVGAFEHIVGIIGVILMLVGLISLADIFGDQKMRSDSVMWFIYAIIAFLVLTIGGALSLFPLFSLMEFALSPPGGFGHMALLGIVVFIIVLVIAFVFFLLSADKFKSVMAALGQRTGESLFGTAGTLYYWGAVLTIVIVGAVLLFVALILAGIAFLTAKIPQASSQR